MNNKVKLSQASMIVTLGVLLALITTYFPMLGLLSIIIPVPYAIIGTMTDKKYSVLSLIVTFFILMFSVNIVYAIKICTISALPGIVIGNAARENIKSEYYNKFNPIYIGMIAVVISNIIFYILCKMFFGIDLLQNLINIMKESATLQIKIMESTGIPLIEGINANQIVDFMSNLISTMLFMQGIIVAFIIYYGEVFILKRIRMFNLELPKLTEFYLPGNAITITFMLYLFVLFLDLIGIKLYTDLIIMNLQLVFGFMFMIQGIGVCIYYCKYWIKSREMKKIFIWVFMLYIFGFMGISFIGMLDSIIDFRKIRSYKST